jgi:hypothetical protein
MRALLPSLCFLIGAGLCIRALTLFPRLGRERIGPPVPGQSIWKGWIPGEYTAEGQRIRRSINRLLLLGYVALFAGFLL